ncbi:MAG: DUF885 domain-containing protein [Bacteroidota bacterium]|nr:DUF885 domain-containing protein [Bacteroidota bacterium]
MYKNIYLILLLCFLSTVSFRCTSPGSSVPEPAVVYTSEEMQAESKKANDFFEQVFNESVDRKPETQTMYGIKKDYDKWNDISDEFVQQELQISKQNFAYLNDSINYEALDYQTKLSFKLFEYEVAEEIEKSPFRFHDYPVNQMFGFQSFVGAFLINFHQISNKEDAEAYIARLNNIPAVVDQLIENLKVREQKGVVLPKFLFPKVISDSRKLISGQPLEQSTSTNSLFEDFKKKISDQKNISSEEREQLLKNAEAALKNSFKPSYEKLISFLESQEKRAGDTSGIWHLPNGEKYYNLMLKYTTTTDMSADEIHSVGLKEVSRIHEEMKDIMKKVGFKGTLQEFFTFMEKDPQFYYSNTDEGRLAYLDSAVVVIANMKTRLDELFITKPKADMVVRRVEAFRETSAGKAFYYRPAPDGSRPGIYYANLYDMTAMPKYEMEALAYHEGLPGHHMQIAIAQELEGLPKFRTLGGYTAYTEGWGLYCELVPKEIGLYENPYSDFGRLAMELWRACRLVVDTGIHAKKWTREDGLKYYRNNTAAAEFEVESMVDRHIVIPSQATAYKIGMMKILELRENAKSRLGSKFDLREFHDVVLTNGAVPLEVLEELVEQYILNELAS